MLVTPINCMYAKGSNDILTYNETTYNNNNTRMGVIYDDSLSLFKIKSGSLQHYLEPYFFNVTAGSKFEINFEGRKISGNVFVDIQVNAILSDMTTGSNMSDTYKFPITETYFKKYKIVVATPESINGSNIIGFVFNIRTVSANTSWWLRNLNIDVIDNKQSCIPKIKGVELNSKVAVHRMKEEAKLVSSEYANINAEYSNGVINCTGSGFKGVVVPIGDSQYNNAIVITGEYKSDIAITAKSSNTTDSVSLPASNNWVKFTKHIPITSRYNSKDLHVSIGTSSNGNVNFRNLRVVDIQNDKYQF